MVDQPSDKSVDLLLDRLESSALTEAERDLVLSAVIGPEALAACLGGEAPKYEVDDGSGIADPLAVFLSSIAVEGLRGIGDRAELGLSPEPGLTIVAGRNGTGKSSFSEAAELVLTGSCSRWSGRKRVKVWEEGWANLHHTGDRTAEVRLALEGEPGHTVVSKHWAAGADLGECDTYAQRQGAKREAIESLGFDSALAVWRPFLSYSELGGLLEDGPSRLYDAISRILGLEEWVAAEQSLNAARKTMEGTTKETGAEATRIRNLLADIEDDRATEILQALPARKAPDLKRISAVAVGEIAPVNTTALEKLASISPGDSDTVAERAEALQQAIAEVNKCAGTVAGRAREMSQLLERALKLHAHEDGGAPSCPVCGTTGVLDAAWEQSTAEQIKQLKEDARAAESAAKQLDAAVAAARALLTAPPSVLKHDVPGIDTSRLTEKWSDWQSGPETPTELVVHLSAKFQPVAEEAEVVRSAATTEVAHRKDIWQPIAARVQAWIPQAEQARKEAPVISHLKQAAHWLATETTTVRNERFVPIAEEVLATWEALRQNSSVSLDKVVLEGTNTRRRVGLSVSVDDVSGQAIAVMSQGELHALALSLFLPRATLKESPFRFIVIDDPVQAMDAGRVDGLAHILARAGQTHQVVVLTHDERLREATHRLGLPATVLEVTRSRRSKLTIRRLHHPVLDYLDDARALLKTDTYPEEARRRVVPGLCRNALEAACSETTMRKLLVSGVSHADAADTLSRATTLIERLAGAFWGDPGKASEVLTMVNQKWGRKAGDCVMALKSGAHELINEDPVGLVAETDRLAKEILALK